MRKCPVCKASGFDTIDDLRSHRRTKHPDRVTTCTCGRSFLEVEYMQQHLRDLGPRHGEKKSRQRNRARKQKPRVPRTSGSHDCAMCGRSFAKTMGLNSHTKAKHPKAVSSTGASGSSAFVNTSSSINIPPPSSGFGSSNDYTMTTSQSLPADLYDVDSSNLDKFIAARIQPDDSFLTQCSSVVNRMAEYLKGPGSPFRPREIIKSGSLGKGTSVKGKSDVDLILMLNENNDVESHMRELPLILQRLEKFVKDKTAARHTNTTRFSVQAEMYCDGEWLDVDILPAVDLTGMGVPLRDIYDRMKQADRKLIHEYSVTLSQLQLDIIKPLPTKVKSLIRVLKYWRNNKLKGSSAPSFAGNTAWPNSYCLELIVLNCWIQAGQPYSFDMTRALHSVLTSLVNHNYLAILLPQYRKYEAGMERHSGIPYIMDPTNPFNDMYHGLPNGEAFDWEPTATKVSQWLNKSLFRGVRGTGNRW
ncbi:2'-5'-oligoadenylate synthetase [Mactra antiquata]